MTSLKIHHTWCDVETIDNGNAYLSHLGLLCGLYCYFLFMNILEENNHCQAEPADNLHGLLDEGHEVTFRELHAIKSSLLTSIQ